MIVVDSSAVAAFILREKGWDKLADYLKRAITIDHLIKEVSNAIWKATCIHKYLDVDDALKTFTLLRRLIGKNIIIYPELDYLDKAFHIALNEGITIYDALYIALALEHKVSLLTLDKKQASIAKKLGVKVIVIK